MSDNERSGYTARELKSVYVTADAVLLKLIFHHCHHNIHNVYSQIGLLALTCFGEIVTDIARPDSQEGINLDAGNCGGGGRGIGRGGGYRGGKCNGRGPFGEDMDEMDEMNGNISKMNNNLKKNRGKGYDPDTMTMMAKLKA